MTCNSVNWNFSETWTLRLCHSRSHQSLISFSKSHLGTDDAQFHTHTYSIRSSLPPTLLRNLSLSLSHLQSVTLTKPFMLRHSHTPSPFLPNIWHLFGPPIFTIFHFFWLVHLNAAVHYRVCSCTFITIFPAHNDAYSSINSSLSEFLFLSLSNSH